MAKNFIQTGDHLTVTSGDTYASGDVVIAGELVGVALGDATTGSDLVLATEGVFELPKDTTEPAAVGDALFTDSAGAPLRVTGLTDDVRVGLAVAPADTAVATVRCKLSR